MTKSSQGIAGSNTKYHKQRTTSYLKTWTLPNPNNTKFTSITLADGNEDSQTQKPETCKSESVYTRVSLQGQEKYLEAYKLLR